MWFKNIQLYRLPTPWSMDLARFVEQLERNPFTRCSGSEQKRSGWVSPRKDGYYPQSGIHRKWFQTVISLEHPLSG